MALDTKALRAQGWRDPPAQRELRVGEVQLWLVRVPQCGHSMDALLERLTPEERERSDAKKIMAKRREYITGQATLRTVLGAQLGIDPQQVRYRRGVKGKPYLRDAPTQPSPHVQFNITHSGEMVIMAMALDTELGVDVEWHNERTDPQRVARRAFTDNEREAMNALPQQQQRPWFFQLWTCKEALVKCTGLGIHSGMSSYEIVLAHDGSARVDAAWGKQAGVQRLCVVPIALGENDNAVHAAALVHEPPALRVQRWILDESPDPLAAVATPSAPGSPAR